ncbi:MAG TPA: glycosyltransferase family 2 protein [Bacteroidota bacterium]|nr:glycosyltransferase family 2 protein [Bacteroidota bacterium]
MKITIVTPSFNQGIFIEDTIRSVMHQDHGDVEHIVVDGGSTDNTVEVLKKYPHLRWVSERDTGQSNAINKGFSMASGEILAWLNSDDVYEEDVLGAVAGHFDSHPDCMLLYGDITFVDRSGNRLFEVGGRTMDYASLLENPDRVRQPSCFWRRELVSEIGGIDERLHVVLDLDFFLRAGAKFPFDHLAKNLSRFRVYEQGKSMSLARLQVREIYGVYRKNNIPLTPGLLRILTSKYVRSFPIGDRIMQYVRGPVGPAR